MRWLIIILFACLPAQAKRLHYEAEYQAKWCNSNNGKMEIALDEHTRVDCLTEQYAIEFDFANKFYEAIGQSLLYGILSNKQPGIVLIMENPETEQKYLYELNKVAEKYNIKIWTMEQKDL